MFGHWPYRLRTVTDDSSKRTDALIKVDLRIEELERRMRVAKRDERHSLNDALMAAYDDRDAAADLPDEKRETITDTGRTVAEVWEEANDRAREHMIDALGSWVVVEGTRGQKPHGRLLWVGITEQTVEDTEGESLTLLLGTDPETGTARAEQV
jgi:hypothetical protein